MKLEADAMPGLALAPAELLCMRLQAHYPGLEEVRWIHHPEGLVEQIAAFAPDMQQGLCGMQGRMELLDGLLRVASHLCAGTTVRASVPTGPVPRVAP